MDKGKDKNEGKIETSWFVSAGTVLIAVMLLAGVQVRGLHTEKVEIMAKKIEHKWLQGSSLTVQVTANGIYKIIDGLHRLSALLLLIACGKLPATFEVNCMVFRQDTPADELVSYALLANLGTECTAPMTFIDKMRWMVNYAFALLDKYIAANPRLAPKRKEQYTWKIVSPDFVATSLEVEQKGPTGMTRGPLQRMYTILKAIRIEDEPNDESTPLLYQNATAFTEIIAMDQLGEVGYVAWFAMFAHSFALAGDLETHTAPGFKKIKNTTIWEAPYLMRESTTVNGIFASPDNKNGILMPAVLSKMPFPNVAYHFITRCYIAIVARTGVAATHEDGIRFLHIVQEHPDIVVSWVALRMICEGPLLVATTSAGFGMMAENKAKKDYDENVDLCQCPCHDFHARKKEGAMWDGDMGQIPEFGALKPCMCGTNNLDPNDPHFVEHGAKFLCDGRYRLHVFCMAPKFITEALQLEEAQCSYAFGAICVQHAGFKHKEAVVCHKQCSNAPCTLMSCPLCLESYATNLCLQCYVAARRLETDDQHKRLSLPYVLERHPLAKSATKTQAHFNPKSRRDEDNIVHQRINEARSWMCMLELCYPAMSQANWEPLRRLQAFLRPEEVKEEAPLSEDAAAQQHLQAAIDNEYHGGNEQRSPTGKHLLQPNPNKKAPKAAKVVDPDTNEANQLRTIRTKELLTYQRNVQKVRYVPLSWQQYYDQGMAGKANASQGDFIPLVVADFIHADPMYGPTHHPGPDLMGSFRDFLDASSKEGSVFCIWGHFGELTDWKNMLEGAYSSKKIQTRWIVDPSLLTAVRPPLRNTQAHNGP